MTELTEPAMEAEFDTVAAWTQQAVTELGLDYAIPAACRGSGSEVWLQWMAERLDLTPNTKFLDAGAGLGGPAAWLRECYNIVPILAEPMQGACHGARRLFDLPTVAAWSQQLPFGGCTFDAGWLLGVLCTTRDQAGLLNELHRVLAPGAKFGFLVLVQVKQTIPIEPEGNHFPTPATLKCDLDATGFEVIEQVATCDLPSADVAWQRRVAAVDNLLERRFRDRPAWLKAREQGERISLLLYGGSVETWLVAARRRSA